MKRRAYLFIAPAILLGFSTLAAAGGQPWVRVSLTSRTLRVHSGQGPDAIFPAAVGRKAVARPHGRRRHHNLGPRGRWFTGPDAKDASFYIAARHQPAFYEGLPQLRLSPVPLRGRRDPAYARAAKRPFFIHGKVTPSLIWGAVTAGCVRLQRRALEQVYALARRSPSLPVIFSLQRDPLPPAPAGACPEAARGARPMRQLRYGRREHGRLCGGVDHWFALELQGGDLLSVSLGDGGGATMELYGIRAISAVARGELALRHRVPLAASNSGFRYLRIVAPKEGTTSYSLKAQRLR